jgi:hypothetical protein
LFSKMWSNIHFEIVLLQLSVWISDDWAYEHDFIFSSAKRAVVERAYRFSFPDRLSLSARCVLAEGETQRTHGIMQSQYASSRTRMCFKFVSIPEYLTWIATHVEYGFSKRGLCFAEARETESDLPIWSLMQ